MSDLLEKPIYNPVLTMTKWMGHYSGREIERGHVFKSVTYKNV